MLEATSSTAWRNIPRPALLLDLMAELGPNAGFCAWSDTLTKDHDRVAAYLGSVGIDQCEEWRERYQILSAQDRAGRFGAERLNLQSDLNMAVKGLLLALHSTAKVARYLDCDRSEIIAAAFPKVRLEALDRAEDLLGDKTSVAWKGDKVRRTILGREIGMAGERAMQIAWRLGYGEPNHTPLPKQHTPSLDYAS